MRKNKFQRVYHLLENMPGIPTQFPGVVCFFVGGTTTLCFNIKLVFGCPSILGRIAQFFGRCAELYRIKCNLLF